LKIKNNKKKEFKLILSVYTIVSPESITPRKTYKIN
nr:hypothetical protein [Candidatus Anoxychlamydiales bacterium]